MEKEKKNQIIILAVIGILLILVLAFIIYSIISKKDEKIDNLVVKVNQIYSSDYELNFLGEKYFIGSYEEKKVSKIIDDNGTEIVKLAEDVYYDNFYKMKDGRYLIYNNLNDTLTTYVFDGENFKNFYVIKDVVNVKPILYRDGKEEYIVGFTSNMDDKLYVYKIDNSGIVIIDNGLLMSDMADSNAYYTNNENYLVVKNREGLMGVIDLNGKVIIDYKYKNILATHNNSFIVVNNKGKYGIVDKDNKEKVKINYKAIYEIDNYFLIVDNKNKMALYDYDYNDITGFKMNYNGLFDFDLRSTINSINLYKVGNNIAVINNNMESVLGTEYEKHNLYVINNGKIVKNIEQIGFDASNVVYSINKDNKLILYDEFFEEKVYIDLEDINKVSRVRYITNNMIEVQYGDFENVYYDLTGQKTTNEYGNLVKKNDIYSIFVKNAESDINILEVYDKEMNLVSTLEGKKIKLVGEYIIVDNSIYKVLYY